MHGNRPGDQRWSFAKAMFVVVLIFSGFIAVSIFAGRVAALLFLGLVVITAHVLRPYVDGGTPGPLPPSTNDNGEQWGIQKRADIPNGRARTGWGGLDEAKEWDVLPVGERREFDRWLRGNDLQVQHRGWFGAGRSGAPIGVAELSQEGAHSQLLVLKFCDHDGECKALAFRRAVTRSPKGFRTSHLVEVVGDAILLDRWWLIRQRIAGGDLSTVRPLTELMDQDDFSKWCKTIVKSLIVDWNEDQPQQTRLFTVKSFLERIMKERIEPGGPIPTRIAELGIPLDAPAVHVDGWAHLLRNPLVLLAEPTIAGRNVESVHVGHGHGDLSGRNILVPTVPKVQAIGYLLIDFDRYEDDGPLARDPMHLLVALAIDCIADYQPESSVRRDLIEVIVDPMTRNRAHADSLRRISAAMHEGSAEWAIKRGYGRHWREQSLLSLVAAALMHVGRDLPTRTAMADRRWCFDLAAVAADAYLRLVERSDPYGP